MLPKFPAPLQLLFSLGMTLLCLAPTQSTAETIYNGVDLDVPVVSETYWFSRHAGRHSAPRQALKIDMFGTATPELSIWQGRTVTASYTDINLYVKGNGRNGVSFHDRHRGILDEGASQAGQFAGTYLSLALSARVIHERCNGTSCIPERTLFGSGHWRGLALGGAPFSGYLGVSSSANGWWRQSRQHGWLQVDVTEDLHFSVKAFGYETEQNVASVVGAVGPVDAVVPLPASVLALLAALGSLFVLRRRAHGTLRLT